MRTINLTNKTLREFTKDDTIYISKNENGFQKIYLCTFLKLERGVVHAIVKEPADWSNKRVGELITTRSSACMLWGSNKDDKWDRCHWFKSLDAVAK